MSSSVRRIRDRWMRRAQRTASEGAFALATTPWSLSLDMLQVFDGETRLWSGDAQPRTGPLGLALETFYAGGVTGSRIPWLGPRAREMANRIRAFAYFNGTTVHGTTAEAVPFLREDRSALPSAEAIFDRLWIDEGCGYRLAIDLRRDLPAIARRIDQLPRGLQPVWTSGAGLALAISAVSEIRTSIDDGVAAFEQAVRQAIAPRLATAALENLGLAVRTLHPELLLAVGEACEYRGFGAAFWHGAGRGLYFAPTGMLAPPGFVGSDWERASSDPPPARRADSVAGYAWALTLVNLRHPRVVASRLRTLDGRIRDAGSEGRWMAQGVAAALAFWLTVGGDRGTVEQLLAEDFPLRDEVRSACGQLLDAANRTSAARLFERQPIHGSDR